MPGTACSGSACSIKREAFANPPESCTIGAMAERFEYKVVELREKLLGGKMSGAKLEKILNEHAAEGWQLKAVTTAEIKGRIGPGGVEGVLITFERRAA